MGRWQPEALPRLQQAAMELFLENGYDKTTVEQIARRAGLTQRTFFRYFADKKEVLFAGTEQFEVQVLERLKNHVETDPLRRVCRVLELVAAAYFDTRPSEVRRRRGVIASSPELQEREGQKMLRVGDQVARVLTEAGHPSATARFAADLGILVFRSAFAQWADSGQGTLAEGIREKFQELQRMTAGVG